MILPIDPAEFAMLMSNGYFGVPDDKLKDIAETMHRRRVDLNEAAWECDIDPANLTDSDRAAVREYCDLLEDE